MDNERIVVTAPGTDASAFLEKGTLMIRVVTAAGALAVALTAGALSAAPAAAAVPPHDHWLTTGSGDVVHVGPDVCANPDIYAAWLNFHLNVHRGVPGTQAFEVDSNPVSISASLCTS